MIIRVVDIGSNSVKASQYLVERGKQRLLSKNKLDYSLGNLVFAKGSIPDAGADRIAKFIRELPRPRAGKPQFTFIVATSAVRSAKNRSAFTKRLEALTGIDVRVLSGAEESYLIHMGILSQAAAKPGEVIKTIDIGGGSAEISWSRGMKYLSGKSYELGAIRVAQRFVDGKPFTRAVLAKIGEHALKTFRAHAQAEIPAAHRAIGSSGNLRALGHVMGKLRGQSLARLLPGVTPGALEDLAELAVGRTPRELGALLGLRSQQRIHILMPAAMILLAGMRHFGIPRLTVTEAGLREGAAYFWSRHGHLTLPVSE
jgi:exopolyphosphatase/guanosine-5'-triphosphate,3'-diphosphate pyrophosphatase